MNKRSLWALIALVLLISCPVTMFLTTLPPFLSSFPVLFLGQVNLTRGSGPVSTRKYFSEEFVLGQIKPKEIKRAEYIHLYDDMLFWGPHYPGYRRTELSGEEITLIQDHLSQATLFDWGNRDEAAECLIQTSGEEPTWTTCEEGARIRDQHADLIYQATRDRDVGVLLFHLTRNRRAEIRIFPGNQGVAFDPEDQNAQWWFFGISQPIPELEGIAARARVEPIRVYWPWLNSTLAHARGRQVFGSQYQGALDAVKKSPHVREIFGEIADIRPAVGKNYYSGWMDCNDVFLTFYVQGSYGEGLVAARGEDCFLLDVIYQGLPVYETRYGECIPME